MKKTGWALPLVVFLFLSPSLAATTTLDSLIEKELPAVVAAYQLLHAAPELSGQEEKTSAYLATELRALGYEVTEGIGKYRMRPWKGYGVVTVGSIHGGSSHNIIPDEVRLELTIRTLDKKVRDKIFQAIERIAKGVAQMAGVPEDRAPIVKFRLGLPATYNHPELSESIAGVWKKELGEENVLLRKPVMGSEDFGAWGLGGQIPVFMFWLGAADPEQLKTSRQTGVGLPATHSPQFAPVPEPTIRTGVKAMATAVLDLLKKPAAAEKKTQ